MRDSQGNPVRSAEGGCVDSNQERDRDATDGCRKAPRPITYRLLQNLIPQPVVRYSDPAPLPPITRVRFVPRTVFVAGQAGITVELRDELNGFLESLEGYQRIERFALIGHSDGNPNRGYGEWLGGKRAESVRNFLVARGIAAAMIESQGTAVDEADVRQRIEITVAVRGRR